jgi:hypothetical protein
MTKTSWPESTEPRLPDELGGPGTGRRGSGGPKGGYSASARMAPVRSIPPRPGVANISSPLPEAPCASPRCTWRQPAAEEAWVELGWTKGCGRRGAPGDAYEGTLPQPVFRQPDVTGHTRTDRPDR